MKQGLSYMVFISSELSRDFFLPRTVWKCIRRNVVCPIYPISEWYDSPLSTSDN